MKRRKTVLAVLACAAWVSSAASATGPIRRKGNTLVTAQGELIRIVWPLFCEPYDDHLAFLKGNGFNATAEGGTKLEHLDGAVAKIQKVDAAGMYFMCWFWGDGGDLETNKQWYTQLLPKIRDHKNVFLNINGGFYATTQSDQKTLYDLIRSQDPDIWIAGKYVFDIPGAKNVAYENDDAISRFGSLSKQGPLFSETSGGWSPDADKLSISSQHWVPGQNCLEPDVVEANILDGVKQGRDGKAGIDWTKRLAPTLKSKTKASGNGPVAFAVDAAPPDGDPLGYSWDFGDGAKLDTDVSTVTHGYASTGTFKAMVTIKGDDLSPGVSDTIEVKVGTPTAVRPAPAPAYAAKSRAYRLHIGRAGAPDALDLQGKRLGLDPRSRATAPAVTRE